LEEPNSFAAPVCVDEDRVVVGQWSAGLGEVIAASAEVRGLVRQGRTHEARLALQERPAEAQAALIALDTNPEEVLSLTGMGADGVPAYRREVVDHLPSPVLAELVAPGTDLMRFNTQLLATMSPETLGRTVDETLDPVYYHGYRRQVSWEWMEALAALADTTHMAELLSRVDESVLEEALVERVEEMDLLANVAPPNCPPVAAYQLLSASASGIALPAMKGEGDHCVLRALHRAAPELMTRVMRGAWERCIADDGEDGAQLAEAQPEGDL